MGSGNGNLNEARHKIPRLLVNSRILRFIKVSERLHKMRSARLKGIKIVYISNEFRIDGDASEIAFETRKVRAINV